MENKKGSWIIQGQVLFKMSPIKKLSRTVLIRSEGDLEVAEKALRSVLAKFVFDCFDKTELKDVRIEVESNIQ